MTYIRVRFALATMLLAGAALAGQNARDKDADEKLHDLLRDGQYQAAYDSLGGHGKADAAGLADLARTLLGVSINSSDQYVRWFALRASRSLSDADIAEAAQHVARTGDRYERSLALEILANSDPKANRNDFVAALGSPFRSVRLRALRTLAQLKDPSLIEHLAPILTSDTDPELRAFAALALGETGSPAAIAALYPGIDDPIPLVQEESVRALATLGDRGIAGVLRKRLAESAPENRVATVRLVAFVPDPELTHELGPLLADPDPEVRAFAASAILAHLRPTPAKAH